MARQVRSAPEIPDMEVLRQIGGGSYGEIWMARSVTDTLRAVKLVYRNDFDDDRTFEREFEGILKYEPVAREHPGLVDILHVGRDKTGDEEFYYYVMELGDDIERGSKITPADYEPRTLRSDMLRSGKRPLAVGFCAEAGARLSGALAHLHERGLAHRDVKPSNVIFVKGQACLADIGLVAARDQRTFVGTEGFVPPEGPGSAGADVYALGKVLYEMATGKDRLDFPELPDEPIPKADNKRWLALNKVICETCDPRINKRRYTEAADLERVLGMIYRSRRVHTKRPPLGLTCFGGGCRGRVGCFGGTPTFAGKNSFGSERYRARSDDFVRDDNECSRGSGSARRIRAGIGSDSLRTKGISDRFGGRIFAALSRVSTACHFANAYSGR